MPHPSPRRRISLTAAFQSIWTALKGAARRAAFNPGGRRTAVPDAFSESALFSIRQDRRSIIDDIKRLYVTDPRFAGIIEASCSDATIGGFDIVMKNLDSTADIVEKRAFQIMQRLKDRHGFDTECEDWAKRLLMSGDLYGQLLFDPQTHEIVDVVILESSITHPYKDNRGQWIAGPEKAYFQTDGLTDTPVQWFAEWEIVHIKWGTGKGDIYGQSQYRQIRKSSHILEKSLEDLALRRRTRTGLRYLHLVDGTWEHVEEYKERNKETIDNPFDVTSDFFANRGVDIKPLVGDMGIGDISDILLFINEQFVRGRYPKALLGFEGGVNGDLLEVMLEEYHRYLSRINNKLEEFLRGVFARALLFQGINDESIEYSLEWGPKTEESQDIKIARSWTLRSMGIISAETALKIADIPGVSWDSEQEKIQAEADIFPFNPFSLANGRPFTPTSRAELMATFPSLFGLPEEGEESNSTDGRKKRRTRR